MDLQYLLREPEFITSETQVLVLLHGYGSNEEDLFSFRETLPKDWLIVSFRAPKTVYYGGYAWYDIDFVNTEKFINVEEAVESMKAIMKSVEEIKKNYGLVNPVHLCGFSQGGILSYGLSLTYPQYFKKVACLSSYPEPKILNNIKTKKELTHLQFFVSHGNEDAVIPLEWGRKAAELLYDLSVFFSFREYMSGHGVNQKNYMDLMEFFNK